MEYSYKFRIYPNEEQATLIQKTFGCCRKVHNIMVDEREEAHDKTGRYPSCYDQVKELPNLKQQFTYMREVDSTALQAEVEFVDCAYKRYKESKKSGNKVGKPRRKCKHDRKQSYTTKNVVKTIEVFGKSVKLPKLGWVKCRVSKQVKGRILRATVSQNPSGKYFVSICCTDVEIKPFETTGAVVGVDLGVKDLAITSDGDKYPNNHYTRKSEKKLARLQRQLSRKSKDSKRCEKARIKVARLHEHIANQRRDSMQKLTTDLIRKYDVICIEDLNASGMVKNHKLAKSVSDASFFEFRRELEYKAKWYGKYVSVIDTFYPSSQLCSNCGTKWSGTKDLSVRSWTCPCCGETHDRDINAAKNILTEGLRIIA